MVLIFEGSGLLGLASDLFTAKGPRQRYRAHRGLGFGVDVGVGVFV